MPSWSRGQKQVLARMGKFMQSGWFVKGDEDSNQSRRALIAHNITANLIGNLIGGNFFTGLLIVLRADDAFVGLITMLTFGANLLQLFAPYVLERFERRKPLLIALKIIAHLVSIVFIGLIPLLPAHLHTQLVLLAISVTLVNSLGAVMSPGISVWHIAHIPPRVRVQYFSLVSMLNGSFIALFNLLGSLVVDHFKLQGQELSGLLFLRGIALIIAVLDIYLLFRIKELPRSQPQGKVSLKSLFTLPFLHPAYLRSVAIVLLWSLVVNLPGGFYSVYLLRELNVSYSYITLVNALNVLVLLLLTPLWRKIFLKYSWLKPLSLAILALAPHYAVLAFVSKGLFILYPIGMVWSFVCSSGINLAFASVAFLNLPEGKQTLFVGFYSTANFLAALTAATLARTFITKLNGLRFTLLGVQFGEKQLLMLLVSVLMLGVGLAVRYIARKNSQEGLEC